MRHSYVLLATIRHWQRISQSEDVHASVAMPRTFRDGFDERVVLRLHAEKHRQHDGAEEIELRWPHLIGVHRRSKQENSCGSTHNGCRSRARGTVC